MSTNNFFTKAFAKSFLVYSLGLFIHAVGTCLVIKASLGASPVVTLPYTISLLELKGVSFGLLTLILGALFILGQVILLRDKFRKFDLIQLPLAFLFGLFIDISMVVLSFITPEHYLSKIGVLVLGCVVVATGITIESISRVTMLSAEAFVRAITIRTGWEFGLVKIGLDSSLTLMACGLSYLFFGEIMTVREGTFIAAILVGLCVRLIMQRIRPVEIRLFPGRA